MPHRRRVSAFAHNSLQVSYLSSHVDKLVIVIAFRYFRRFLHVFSSYPFYNTYLKLPKPLEHCSEVIQYNPRFYPYFADTIRALDGTHIVCHATEVEREMAWNCKGFLSQNCLVACSFDLRFTYVVSSWDGCTSDSAMLHDAHFTDFPIPPNKFYLADAGFPLISGVLVPYRGHCYHLNEWRRGNCRPSNKEELFNLRHASACNVIERIFGIIKCHFQILVVPPEYQMKEQVMIPPTLCALHNFICRYDPFEPDGHKDKDKDKDKELDTTFLNSIDPLQYGFLATALPTRASHANAEQWWEDIAEAMWRDYNVI